jgi:hypothetical protein
MRPKTMNDADRKILTEMIGECWHEDKLFKCDDGSSFIRCPKCKLPISKWNLRSFTTPDDLFAVKEAIEKMGKWEEFFTTTFNEWYAVTEIPDDRDRDAMFSTWLFRPTINGEPHFCQLVAEFLEGRK